MWHIVCYICQNIYMKGYGILILICGIIALCIALCMDTSVSSSGYSYSKVENIGLLNQKSNWVVVSCFTCLIGCIFIAFGSKDEDTALLRRIILKLEEQVDETKKQSNKSGTAMKNIAIFLAMVMLFSCKKKDTCMVCHTYISKVQGSHTYPNAKPTIDTSFCEGNYAELKANYIKRMDGYHSAWPQNYYYWYQTECK